MVSAIMVEALYRNIWNEEVDSGKEENLSWIGADIEYATAIFIGLSIFISSFSQIWKQTALANNTTALVQLKERIAKEEPIAEVAWRDAEFNKLAKQRLTSEEEITWRETVLDRRAKETFVLKDEMAWREDGLNRRAKETLVLKDEMAWRDESLVKLVDQELGPERKRNKEKILDLKNEESELKSNMGQLENEVNNEIVQLNKAIEDAKKLEDESQIEKLNKEIDIKNQKFSNKREENETKIDNIVPQIKILTDKNEQIKAYKRGISGIFSQMLLLKNADRVAYKSGPDDVFIDVRLDVKGSIQQPEYTHSKEETEIENEESDANEPPLTKASSINVGFN